MAQRYRYFPKFRNKLQRLIMEILYYANDSAFRIINNSILSDHSVVGDSYRKNI
ncbi:MAG TPA: hypothetical protein VN040_23620 [Pseudosphingobacterium sp.]|nr:hypothetical protein [Pseudosphingobacterium sp.]